MLKTLEHQDGSKKAWRLVGDVLVERTVAEVIPEVTKQRDNLMALAQNTRKQLEAKQKEVLEFQEKYSIRIKGQESGPGSGNGPKAAADQSGAGPSSGQGVLVSDS